MLESLKLKIVKLIKFFRNDLFNQRLNNLLIDAVFYQDLDTVKSLVERGANISYRKNFAIRLAVACGHLRIVKYLSNMGAPLTIAESTGMRMAADMFMKAVLEKNGDAGTYEDISIDLDKYWNHPTSNYGLALSYAIINKHFDVADYLLKRGISIHSGVRIVSEDIQLSISDNPLMWAVQTGDIAIVKYVVKNGGNVNANDGQAFILADGNKKIIKYLKKFKK